MKSKNHNKTYLKRNLNEIIYQKLKENILRGNISSDKKLQEDNLTQDFNTSRTPIRDALRRLEQENIIEKLRYGGYKIKEVSFKEIEEVYGIRCALESHAASLATRRIKKKDIKKLELILEESRKAADEEDYDAFVKLNTEFHRFLYLASDSELLVKILQNVWDYFYRYRKIILSEREHLQQSIKDHSKMIEKMKAGDSEAVEKLVRDHVNNAFEVLKQQMDKKVAKAEGVH